MELQATVLIEVVPCSVAVPVHHVALDLLLAILVVEDHSAFGLPVLVSGFGLELAVGEPAGMGTVQQARLPVLLLGHAAIRVIGHLFTVELAGGEALHLPKFSIGTVIVPQAVLFLTYVFARGHERSIVVEVAGPAYPPITRMLL